nr:NAD(P)/FAD-dependent oxidoreductase [Acidobacterium sp.]
MRLILERLSRQCNADRLRQSMMKSGPVVVIVGGGFGGLAAAKALKDAPVQVVLVDRSNHHLFQPLLYQVATAVLAPGQIATPIRSVLHDQKNATVILGNVVGIDTEAKAVLADINDSKSVPIRYDFLVLATGARDAYFGHCDFERYTFGLKTLADAVALRNRILSVFEMAEFAEDLEQRQSLLTFVLVGAGPTGVEMASAIAVLIQSTLKSDFRRMDPAMARIILVERSDRVLDNFDPRLSMAAQRRLQSLGVELMLGQTVEEIDDTGVTIHGQHIAARTVIWAAGVAPSPAGDWLKAETDKSGRVLVHRDLSVPNLPEVFVVGDTAHFEQNGHPLPGVAQVAIQQGQYAARVIAARVEDAPFAPMFRYLDKGNLAVAGRGFAVLQSDKIKLSGFWAWWIWAAVHLRFLAGNNLRLSVSVQWMWTFLTAQRGSRLIVRHHAKD